MGGNSFPRAQNGVKAGATAICRNHGGPRNLSQFTFGLSGPRGARFSHERDVIGFLRSDQLRADQKVRLSTSSKINSIRKPSGCIGSDAMQSAFNRSLSALAAMLVVAGGQPGQCAATRAEEIRVGHEGFLDPSPPDDWFLGDETEVQKGLAPPSGPPTGASDAELATSDEEDQAAAGLQDRRSTRRAYWPRGKWHGGRTRALCS